MQWTSCDGFKEKRFCDLHCNSESLGAGKGGVMSLKTIML